MKRYELDGLIEGYEIVEPLVVEERRFEEDCNIYISLTILGLENEQVFGFARRFSHAKEMLIDSIVSYYRCLEKSERESPDKDKLMRSIRESNP